MHQGKCAIDTHTHTHTSWLTLAQPPQPTELAVPAEPAESAFNANQYMSVGKTEGEERKYIGTAQGMQRTATP